MEKENHCHHCYRCPVVKLEWFQKEVVKKVVPMSESIEIPVRVSLPGWRLVPARQPMAGCRRPPGHGAATP
jgi:hypothetical protein